jgi:phage virion morphogenesis protein
MTTFTVTVKDGGVQATLQALAARMGNLAPALTSLGDEIVERTKQRFDTATGPDGVEWTGHSIATLAMASGALGKGYRRKNGELNKRGEKKLASKRLLVDSGFLSGNIFPSVSGNTLTIGTPAQYAAIHQFGGQAGRGRKVTIPARPFLPVLADGTLYPQEQQLVLQTLNDFLVDGL